MTDKGIEIKVHYESNPEWFDVWYIESIDGSHVDTWLKGSEKGEEEGSPFALHVDQLPDVFRNEVYVWNRAVAVYGRELKKCKELQEKGVGKLKEEVAIYLRDKIRTLECVISDISIWTERGCTYVQKDR